MYRCLSDIHRSSVSCWALCHFARKVFISCIIIYIVTVSLRKCEKRGKGKVKARQCNKQHCQCNTLQNFFADSVIYIWNTLLSVNASSFRSAIREVDCSGFLSIIQKAAVSAIYKPCSISVVFLSNGYYVFLLASI